MVLSSAKSHIHSSLRLRLPISFSSNNGPPARAAATMRGRDQTLYCLLSSHTPGASRKSLSLSLWSLQAVLQWPWPECIWYYSRLNVGFTEATWIKRVAARMYLVLCNAVNRFAEWGFNVFVYTNIMSTSWNSVCEAERWRFLKWQVWHFDVSERLPPLVVYWYCTNRQYMDRVWKCKELIYTQLPLY